MLLTSISGDKIHCRLVCPWAHSTQLQTYTGTQMLCIFIHGTQMKTLTHAIAIASGWRTTRTPTYLSLIILGTVLVQV